ncbi:hypothetical protein [Moorena bouillonii]|uniref:hypothetical protein n=1 Tax=Moorena bouillonii TaxID=207920 RepID=UPI0013018B7A|nr:hypothetical protein [Moorena bouillonii]
MLLWSREAIAFPYHTLNSSVSSRFPIPDSLIPDIANFIFILYTSIIGRVNN